MKLISLLVNVYTSRSTTPSNKREWFATTSYNSPYKMSYEKYILSTKDIGDLALVFHASYERSADDARENKIGLIMLTSGMIILVKDSRKTYTNQ